VDNEDIALFDGTNVSLWFDGTDAGLATKRLGAFSVISSTELLFSLTAATSLPGISETVDDSVAINEDSASTVFVLVPNGGAADYDPDGTLAPTSVAAVGLPSFGSLVNNNNGTFQYTPNSSFSGTDTFTYTVRDNLGATSNVATVTVSVGPVNDPPTLSGIPDVVMMQETSNQSIDLDN